MNFAVYPSLADRVVLVTGGSSGIGAALVTAFVAQGARVAFLDIDSAGAQAVVEANKTHRHPPQFIECDLVSVHALRAAVSRVESSLGAVRVLVNNAANDDREDFREVTPESWDRSFAVNLRHMYFAAQAVAPAMAAAGGGAIVNLGSVAWRQGCPDLSVYGTAKAGVVGLTRSLARRLGSLAIRVNTITPGWTMTERQLRLWATSENLAAALAQQCLKKRIEPDAVARLALFLAADDSSFCTGGDFPIDAGTF
ncbi:MAG TPA: SDR family oxidoreductase [Candidatus Acidoferrales bacterium]|nr:SDR family oxidoreductase [Candidatus Acidoferrales bacterium]